MKFTAIMFVGLLGLAVHAGIVIPVNGTTSDFISYGSINSVIDGVPDYNSSYLVMGNIAIGSFGGPYKIHFDLGGNYSLTGMNFWNNAGNLGNDGEGVRNFSLTFLDASLAVVGSYSDVASDDLNQQVFSFAGVNAAYVDFTILSQHSETSARQYAAFQEINFISPVPEPTTPSLLACSAAMIGMWRRFKRN